MIRREPFEKGEILCELLCGDGRRISFEAGGGLGETRQHRLPIAHHRAHIGEDFEQSRAQSFHQGFIDLAIEGEHDDAFLKRPTLRLSRTRLVACRRNHRVKGGRDAKTLGPDFGDAGIVEERDVVIHRKNDGLVAGEHRVLGTGVEDLDQGSAGEPPLRPREDELHQRRQFRAGVMDQILGGGVAGEGGEERGELGIAGADQMRAHGEMGGRFGRIQPRLFGRGALCCLDHVGCPSHVSPSLRGFAKEGQLNL